jgi:biotin transport system substrate-specific component
MGTHRLPLKTLVYASMFGALTAVGAYISIPLYPVPVTLQTMFTISAGLLLSGPAAALSQVIYVLLGVMGLPVFSGGKAGLGILFGPTGGYLIGFVVGAFVIGALRQARKEGRWAWQALCVTAGEIVIYSIGVLRLTQVAHISFSKAVLVGVLPFLIGDVIKCALSILIVSKVEHHRQVAGEIGLP